MPLPVHWVNGRRDSALLPNDRGFSYGDGLFETLRYHRGRFHLLSQHLDRLRRGCEVLGILIDEADVSAQLEAAKTYLEGSGIDDAAARLAISRGPGQRGYGGWGREPTLVLSLGAVAPWREHRDPMDIIVCELCLAAQPALAGIKHSNRLEQVLAARELEEKGAREGLMLNFRGEVVCAVSANVFAVFDGTLVTPPVSECGVAGTVRQLVLEELAPAAGLPVQVQTFTSADLQQADELFLTNAVAGVCTVRSCGVQRFTSTRQGDTLRSSFYEWSESP